MAVINGLSTKKVFVKIIAIEINIVLKHVFKVSRIVDSSKCSQAFLVKLWALIFYFVTFIGSLL